MVTKAATTPGYAASEAYGRKMREVGEHCRREGMVFIPLALESLGGWHKAAVGEVKKLGCALARHTGQEEGVAISRLFQRLAVLLVKGNMALICNRVPDNSSLAIIGMI